MSQDAIKKLLSGHQGEQGITKKTTALNSQVLSSKKHSNSREKIPLYEALLGEDFNVSFYKNYLRKSFFDIEQKKQILPVKSERKTQNNNNNKSQSRSQSPITTTTKQTKKTSNFKTGKNLDISNNIFEIYMGESSYKRDITKRMSKILECVKGCPNCEQKIQNVIFEPLDLTSRLDEFLRWDQIKKKKQEKQLQRNISQQLAQISLYAPDIERKQRIQSLYGNPLQLRNCGYSQQKQKRTSLKPIFILINELKSQIEELQKELVYWRIANPIVKQMITPSFPKVPSVSVCLQKAAIIQEDTEQEKKI